MSDSKAPNLVSQIAKGISNCDERTILAIDGVDASGKSFFARALYQKLKEEECDAILVSVDDFHNPKTVRYQKGSDSPEGFYFDSNNYKKFKELLLEPFKGGESSVQLKYFDCDKDSEVAVIKTKIPETTILIVEGIFLHRPELAHYWDYSIFLKVDFDTALQRNIDRGIDQRRIGDKEAIVAKYKKRYQPGQQLYINESMPEKRADIVMDNSDFTHPIILKDNLNWI